MRTRYALLVVTAVIASVAIAGSATAAPTLADDPTAETNESDSPTAGVCVIGVDSPCNGEQWDGDDVGPHPKTGDGGPIQPVNETDGDRITTGEKDASDGSAGVCLIGVESPCNGDDAASGSADVTGHETRSLFESVLAFFGSLF